jgi:hypothetical protein
MGGRSRPPRCSNPVSPGGAQIYHWRRDSSSNTCPRMGAHHNADGETPGWLTAGHRVDVEVFSLYRRGP